MNTGAILAAIHSVVVALEQLGVPYYLGGSVVSSTYGIPRATFDVDLIADLRPEHVHPFVKLLEAEYYVDEAMIRDSIRHRSSFNLIYLPSMLKVDIFYQNCAPLIRKSIVEYDKKSWWTARGRSTWHQRRTPYCTS